MKLLLGLAIGMTGLSFRPAMAQMVDSQNVSSYPAPQSVSESLNTAINNEVNHCWKAPTDVPIPNDFSVKLQVTTDATGTARLVQTALGPQENFQNVAYFRLSNRAINAVIQHQCATLPLPADMLGHVSTFFFNFSIRN
jgi:hypothetical protein